MFVFVVEDTEIKCWIDIQEFEEFPSSLIKIYDRQSAQNRLTYHMKMPYALPLLFIHIYDCKNPISASR